MAKDFFQAPDAISYQQLVAFLSSAARNSTETERQEQNINDVPFEELIIEWLRDGEWIMQEIEAQAEAGNNEQTPCQKLAFSAFVVHLSLAMKALEKATGEDRRIT